ncbi:unnamed protein product, partial [Ranitomeya imitator]
MAASVVPRSPNSPLHSVALLSKSFPQLPSPRRRRHGGRARSHWNTASLTGEDWSSYSLSSTTSNNLLRSPSGLPTPDDTIHSLPSCVRSSSRAVLTVNTKTTQVLMANDKACRMFGYSSLELIGMGLPMLIPASSHRISETLEEELIEADGISRVPGEVVEAVRNGGEVIVLCLWIRKVKSQCLLFLDTVQIISTVLSFQQDVCKQPQSPKLTPDFHNKPVCANDKKKSLLPLLSWGLMPSSTLFGDSVGRRIFIYSDPLHKGPWTILTSSASGAGHLSRVRRLRRVLWLGAGGAAVPPAPFSFFGGRFCGAVVRRCVRPVPRCRSRGNKLKSRLQAYYRPQRSMAAPPPEIGSEGSEEDKGSIFLLRSVCPDPSLQPWGHRTGESVDSLIEAVNQFLGIEDELASSSDHKVSFKRAKWAHRVFSSHPEFEDLIRRNQEHPDKRFSGQRALKAIVSLLTAEAYAHSPVSPNERLGEKDFTGRIVSCDPSCAQLYGYMDPEELLGQHITDLMPTIHIPRHRKEMSQSIQQQRVVGVTRNGATFPLSLTLIKDFPDEVTPVDEYYASLSVLSSISGLITLFPDGIIQGINGTFSRSLFGYDRTQLLGKNISFLVPGFYHYMRSAEDEASFLSPPEEAQVRSKSCDIICNGAVEKSVQKCKSEDLLTTGEGYQHPACSIVLSPSSPLSARTTTGHHKSAYGDPCTMNLPTCCFSPGTPTQDELWEQDQETEKCNLHDLLPNLGMELDLAPLTHCLQSMNLTGSRSEQATPCANNSILSSTCASTMKKTQSPPMGNASPVTVQVAPSPASPVLPAVAL